MSSGSMSAVELGLKPRTLNTPGLLGPTVAFLNSLERILSSDHLLLKLELSGLAEWGPMRPALAPGPLSFPDPVWAPGRVQP